METIKPSYSNFRKICRIGEQLLGYDNIKVIFEFGSRYGEDTIEFAKRYPRAKVYGFECNEATLPLCKQKTKVYPNIVLTEKAISDCDGNVVFYPIDKEHTITTWEDGNQGASSLLQASGKYELESYVQKETEVQSITLKSFMEEHSVDFIDIMWMDIQGAELMALKGLKDRIVDVKIIQCEVEKMEIYEGQPLFASINVFFAKHGFSFMGFSSSNEYSADAVFIRKDLVTHRIKKICSYILQSERRTPNCVIKFFYKFQNRILLYLKQRKGFDSSFKVTKPPLTNWEYRHWREKVYNPLMGIDVQYRGKIWDYEKIDIVIPTHEKDYPMLEYCIKSITKYLRHPIGTIYVVTTINAESELIAKRNKCKLVNENTVLKDFSPQNIHYVVNGIDRSGWLFQQLVKLSVDSISKRRYCLVVDSDTIFNRPIKYLHRGKTILNVSDERHEPYYRAYRLLFNEDITSDDSFVAHTMLFNIQVLKEMKYHIEQLHNTDWISAILDSVDYSDNSGFSEYETYGNYLMRHHPDKVKIEYWFNKSISSIDELTSVPNYYKTISLHSYNK